MTDYSKELDFIYENIRLLESFTSERLIIGEDVHSIEISIVVEGNEIQVFFYRKKSPSPAKTEDEGDWIYDVERLIMDAMDAKRIRIEERKALISRYKRIF
ncbi:MAG: hypothetical protein ACC707_01680 [Thiohalomonadales bacterium]